MLTDEGTQVNLLAVSELPAEALIRGHLARWGLQENQLKHGVERWGINLSVATIRSDMVSEDQGAWTSLALAGAALTSSRRTVGVAAASLDSRGATSLRSRWHPTPTGRARYP